MHARVLVSTQLDFNAWLAIAGVLFMVMALSSAYLRRLPVSTAAIYLLLGVMIGPFGLRYLSEPVPLASSWFERTTEIALVISLFRHRETLSPDAFTALKW